MNEAGPSRPARSPSASGEGHFQCQWVGCGKTYKGARHLERHERTHTQQAVYQCQVCGRSYVRSDVLNRHLVQQHGWTTTKRPRQSNCTTCIQERRICDGMPPRACSFCRNRMVTCRYPSQPHDTPPQHVSEPPQHAVSNWTGTLGLSVPENTAGTSSLMATTYSNPMADQSQFTNAPIDNTDQWLNELLAFATGQGTTDESSGIMNGTANAMFMPDTFDWGFGDVFDDTDIFQPMGTHAPPSPVAITGPESGSAISNISEKDEELVAAVQAEEVDGIAPARELPDGRPTTSPWVEPNSVETMDHLVQLPPSPSHQTSSSTQQHAVKASARQAMYTLSLHAHSEIWTTPDLGNFPSEETLSTCAHLYLAHFAGWMPILDSPRGSFLIDKAAPILLKAVAAVGSVYGKGGLEKLGPPLAELVRRDIVFVCEHNPRLASELGLVQASLLQSIFGAYSGSPRLARQAETSRATLVAAVRQMALLKANVSAVQYAMQRGGSKDDLARAAKQDHRRRRLGWAVFLYDVQMACLFDQTCMMAWTDVQAPLPTVAPDTPPPSALMDVMRGMLAGGTPPANLDDIALSCIAHGLYRISIETHQTAAVLAENNMQISRVLLALQSCVSLDTDARLTVPSSLAATTAALAYHAHIRFTEPGLLETVRSLATRGWTDGERAGTEARLRTAFASDLRTARTALAYGGLLMCLLSRFVSDTPPEAALLFDATLAIWAALSFSTVSTPTEGRAKTAITVSWTLTPGITEWIENGRGSISIQGLGELGSLTPVAVLNAGAGRLDFLSWGLAAEYRRALQGLARVSK